MPIFGKTCKFKCKYASFWNICQFFGNLFYFYTVELTPSSQGQGGSVPRRQRRPLLGPAERGRARGHGREGRQVPARVLRGQRPRQGEREIQWLFREILRKISEFGFKKKCFVRVGN